MTAWHFAANGQARGPVSAQQLRELLATGSLGADPLVWTEGMPEWLKASEIAELRNPEPPPPPPPPPLTPGQFASTRGSSTRVASTRVASTRVSAARVASATVASARTPSARIPSARVPPGRVPPARIPPAQAAPAPAEPEQAAPPQVAPPQVSPAQAALAQVAAAQAPSPSAVDTSPATEPTQPGPATAEGTAREFRLGLVLPQSLAILQARIGTWLLIGLIETVLAVPLAFLSVADTAGAVPIAFLPAADIAGKVVSILIGMQVQAMIAFAAFQLCCGQDFRLGDAFRQGGRRLPAILGVFVVTALLLFLSALVAATLGLLLLQPLADTSLAALGYPIAATLAALSFLVLCSIIFIRTAVSIAACVNERLNPIAGFRRSFLLTRGRLWRIFGAYVVLLLAFLAFLGVLTGLFYLAVVLIDPSFPITSLNNLSSILEAPPAIFTVLVLVFLTFLLALWLFSALASILGTSIYANLRMISEDFAQAGLPTSSEQNAPEASPQIPTPGP